MIKRIIVRSFQSHKKSILDLHPAVNVIIGGTDVGKTSLIRAFIWLMLNRPQGDAFRSNFGGETKVIVKTDTDTIVRIKDRKNIYKLNGLEFKALKTDVPEEVSLALNMNTTNVGRQFDRPFLLDSSPGEVAAHFNAVAHLDMIDVSLSRLESWIRSIRQSITNDETTKTEYEESLKQFANLDVLDKETCLLEALDDKRLSLDKHINTLQSIIDAIDDVEQELAELQNTLDLEKPVTKTFALISKRDKIESDKEELTNLVEQVKTTNLRIEKLSHTALLDEIISETMNLMSIRDKRAELITALNTLIAQIKNTDIKLEQLQCKKEQLEKVFHKEFPEGSICPLCGNEK